MLKKSRCPSCGKGPRVLDYCDHDTGEHICVSCYKRSRGLNYPPKKGNCSRCGDGPKAIPYLDAETREHICSACHARQNRRKKAGLDPLGPLARRVGAQKEKRSRFESPIDGGGDNSEHPPIIEEVSEIMPEPMPATILETIAESETEASLINYKLGDLVVCVNVLSRVFKMIGRVVGVTDIEVKAGFGKLESPGGTAEDVVLVYIKGINLSDIRPCSSEEWLKASKRKVPA